MGKKSKVVNLVVDTFGNYLVMNNGCMVLRDKKRNEQKYPLFEDKVGEVQIRIGNSVSSAALATCAFWGIDVLISTQRGNPVAVLKRLEDDNDVDARSDTRIIVK